MALVHHLKSSIDTRIVILTSRKKYLLASVAVLFCAFVVFGYLYIQSESDLGNGYQYVSGRADDFHIRKNGRVVINSTMVDLDIVSEYVVGLRLPAEYLECEGGCKIRLINKKEYFVLFTRNGNVFNFISRDKFEARLKELGIFNDVSLNYTKFESVWSQYSKYYENIDYSACLPINKE